MPKLFIFSSTVLTRKGWALLLTWLFLNVLRCQRTGCDVYHNTIKISNFQAYFDWDTKSKVSPDPTLCEKTIANCLKVQKCIDKLQNDLLNEKYDGKLSMFAPCKHVVVADQRHQMACLVLPDWTDPSNKSYRVNNSVHLRERGNVQHFISLTNRAWPRPSTVTSCGVC